MTDRFLRACRRESTDCTPVWFMRQAGVHLPAYRDLLQRHGMMTLITEPELAVEVTRMPVDQFGVDAAIICSDVLIVLRAMGLDLQFDPDRGATIANPISTHADIESLAQPSAATGLGFVLDAVRASSRALRGRVPVIGFSAAPFTLASYAIEGCRAKHYKKLKGLMYSEPRWWDKLMDKFSHQVSDFLVAQARAGAGALQIFDSWVGTLSPYDFREYVLPHIRRLTHRVKNACPETPLIFFGTRGVGFFPLYRETGADVFGVDWRTDLLYAWEQLGEDVAIQGNLDPALLLAPAAEMQKQTARLLDAVGGRPGHILNLGHGVFRETDPGRIRRLIEFVHSYSRA